MGRVKGRFFTNDFELSRLDRDIRQEQEYHGTTVDWYFYLGSQVDDVYDEGPADWKGPVKMPVVSAVPVQGANVTGDSGLYVTDRITLRLSLDQVVTRGLGRGLSSNFEQHYRDRFVYRNHVYSIEDIRIDGHFDEESRDVMILVTGGQLRGDELYDDLDFAQYAYPPS